MADLSFGLIGLALLPISFFYLATVNSDTLKPFRIAFNGFAFVFLMVFLGFAATMVSDSTALFALMGGVIALFIVYMWMEAANFLYKIWEGRKGGNAS